MILQEKKILCSIKEPDRNHLWLRPILDKDGYDLLYYGVNGWTPLIKYSISTTDNSNDNEGNIEPINPCNC